MIAYSAGELLSTRMDSISGESNANRTNRGYSYGSVEIPAPATVGAGTGRNLDDDDEETSLLSSSTHSNNNNDDDDVENTTAHVRLICSKCGHESSLVGIPSEDDSVSHFLVCSRRQSSTIRTNDCGHLPTDDDDSQFRFWVLFLISLVPFGGHFFKSSISSLEVAMLNDDLLGMNSTRYGVLVSSFAFGNFFLAMFGGNYIDKVDDRRGIMVFITFVLIGEIIFTLSLQIKSYWLLLLGGVVIGSAQGVVSVAHRAIVSRYFANYEIIFAIGWTHGVACLSKMAARASVVPISNIFNSYIAPFYCMIAVSACSFLSAYAYTQLSSRPTTSTSSNTPIFDKLATTETSPLKKLSQNPQHDEQATIDKGNNEEHANIDGISRSERGIVLDSDEQEYHALLATDNQGAVPSSLLEFDHTTLTTAYWLLSILHSLYLMVFHLFPNISGHFLHERHGMSPKEAGFVSSFLTLFATVGAPLTGYILDRSGGQLYIILLAGTITIFSYALISFTNISPIYSILALSVADAGIPTILHALLPLSVDRTQFGIAFGISEVLDASGNIFGNIVVGCLRDASGSYVSPMIFIIVVSVVSIFMSIILIIHDKNKHNSFFNSAMKK